MSYAFKIDFRLTVSYGTIDFGNSGKLTITFRLVCYVLHKVKPNNAKSVIN